MKTLTKELWVEVPERRAIVSIHDEVEQLVAESGVRDGIILVNATHITNAKHAATTSRFSPTSPKAQEENLPF